MDRAELDARDRHTQRAPQHVRGQRRARRHTGYAWHAPSFFADSARNTGFSRAMCHVPGVRVRSYVDTTSRFRCDRLRRRRGAEVYARRFRAGAVRSAPPGNKWLRSCGRATWHVLHLPSGALRPTCRLLLPAITERKGELGTTQATEGAVRRAVTR
ncbi:hypothetical protein ERJ75_001383400 [Trypanosoma vivax]|nr:hypothetical protein ERJ75_001383400 [Trypanosoma vivax]